VAIAPSQIQGALDALDQQIPQSAAEKCAVLLGELDKWNRKVNLTAIRDPEEMITGHLLDSLVARPFLEGERVLDVGTGAGFPGLPLALVEPQRQFALVDSNNKKIQFVQHVAALLGLGTMHPASALIRSSLEPWPRCHGWLKLQDITLERTGCSWPSRGDIRRKK
jgi:16S rRNA G527 N7-methylase RsmG